MAEGVDAIAVDVGDGAIGADREIAGHQLDADHGAGLEVGGIAHGGLDFAAAGDALAGFESEGAELRREGIERGAAESAEGEGRGDIDHAGLAAQDGLGAGNAAREVALVECEGGGGGGGATREGGVAVVEVRSMSSMGRMPAMGSLANGKAMATAPTSLPSM